MIDLWRDFVILGSFLLNLLIELSLTRQVDAHEHANLSTNWVQLDVNQFIPKFNPCTNLPGHHTPPHRCYTLGVVVFQLSGKSIHRA